MVTVLSYNVANYDHHHSWERRLPLLVEAIRQSQADVIALTEMRYNPVNAFNVICDRYWQTHFPGDSPPPNCSQMDTGEQVLYMLQHDPRYREATIYTEKALAPAPPPNTHEGLSIISRLPILSQNYMTLKRAGSDANTRLAQWVEVETPSGSTLWIYNTHFALDETGRMSNAQETLAQMRANLGGYCCLVGDLNATPDEQGLQTLAQAGLVDVWARAHPNEPGYTYPSWGPDQRIDYCWASRSLAPLVGEVRLAPTKVDGEAVTEPDGGVLYTSDHIGLVTTFNIP